MKRFVRNIIFAAAVYVLSTSSVYADAGQDEGLCAQWRFNETDGYTIKDSAGNHDGEMIRGLFGFFSKTGVDLGVNNSNLLKQIEEGKTVVDIWEDDPQSVEFMESSTDGYPIRLEKRFGNSKDKYISFANSGAYIDIKNAKDLPLMNEEGYSISLWVSGSNRSRQNGTVFLARGENGESLKIRIASEYYIGEKDYATQRDLYGFSYYTGNKLGIQIKNSDGKEILNAETTGIVFDGNWHHVVFTDKNGEAAVYIDGVKDRTDFSYKREGSAKFTKLQFGTPADTTKYNAQNPMPTLDMVNGYRKDRYDFYYGFIDNVSIYDKILSSDEAMFLNKRETVKRTPVSYLTFNSGLSDEEKNIEFSGDVQFSAGIDEKGLVIGKGISSLSDNIPNFETGMTFSAWVKKTENGKLVLVSKGEDFELIDDNGLKFVLTQADGTKIEALGKDVPLNEWVHIAVSANGTDIRMYINGELCANPVEYNGTIKDSGKFLIGQGVNGCSGVIDEVRLHNYGLTQTQIKYYLNKKVSVEEEYAKKLFTAVNFNKLSRPEIENAYKSGQYSKALKLFKDFYIDFWCENADKLGASLKDIGDSYCDFGSDTDAFRISSTPKVFPKDLYMKYSEGYKEPGNMDWGWLDSNAELAPKFWWGWNAMTTIYGQFVFPYVRHSARFPDFDQDYEKFWMITDDYAGNVLDLYNDKSFEKEVAAARQMPDPQFDHASQRRAILQRLMSCSGYMIKNNRQMAERYMDPVTAARIVLFADENLPFIMIEGTSTSNHQLSETASLAQYYKAFYYLNRSDEVKQYIYNFYKNITYKFDASPDGGGTEFTWHYNHTINDVASKVLELLKSDSGELDYGLKKLRNAAILKERMTLSSILPYDGQPCGMGVGGGANLFPKTSEYFKNYGVGMDTLDGTVRIPLKDDKLVKQIYGTFDGSNGEEPAFNSICFPYFGLTIFRSGWQEKDHWMMFTGSHAYGKRSNETNEMQIAGLGRMLLARAGYTQATGSTDGMGEPLRQYYYSVFGNNSISVDGYDQADYNSDMLFEKYDNKPIDIFKYKYHSSDYFDYTEGRTQDGYRSLENCSHIGFSDDNTRSKDKITDVVHHREVISLKNKGLYIVTDNMLNENPGNSHNYIQSWNWASSFEDDDFEISQKSVVTHDDKGANLNMYQFTAEDISVKNYYGYWDKENGVCYGWQSRSYGGVPDKSMNVQYTISGLGNKTFVTLFSVNEGTEEQISEMKDLSTKGGANGFYIKLKDGTEVYYLADDKKNVLNIGGVTANANCMLVMTENGVTRGLVIDGEYIETDGNKNNVGSSGSCEFELTENGLLITPVEMPDTFRWAEDENGNIVPKYSYFD